MKNKSIATLKKDLIATINKIQDENFLKAIDEIVTGKLIYELDYDFELTPEQEKELERRSKEVENGTAKFYTWEEVKKNLMKEMKERKKNSKPSKKKNS